MLSSDEWQALWLTLDVSARATLCALPPALLLALALARARFPGRAVLDTLVHLPLVLPPVVVGWLLLLIFGLHGPIGAMLQSWFSVRLVFTKAGAVLACVIVFAVSSAGRMRAQRLHGGSSLLRATEQQLKRGGAAWAGSARRHCISTCGHWRREECASASGAQRIRHSIYLVRGDICERHRAGGRRARW